MVRQAARGRTKMNAILRGFSFLVCAGLVIYWPALASAQSSAAGAGASACAFLAAKLVPEASAATASNPRSALLRRFAHVRDYVGCLRSHGVRPASSQMAAAATYVTFDVPGGVGTSPTAINSVGTIAGLYFDANFVAAHSFVRAPGGALTPFDPPGATGGSIAVAINERGAITGLFCDATTCHGYLRYPGGNFVTFDPPGAQFTFPIAINPAGAVAGFYCDATACHGFLRAPNGAFVAFDPPGPISTAEFAGFGIGNVIGVNANHTITGAFSPDQHSSVLHGFVRTQGGTIATFDPEGSVATSPSDINAPGAITGFYADASFVIHGFLRDRSGTITAFDPPNSFIQTIACCITSAGTITGWYIPPDFGPPVSFLRAPDGTFTSFDVPGSMGTVASAISEAGAVTGHFFDASGETHGFLRRHRHTEGWEARDGLR